MAVKHGATTDKGKLLPPKMNISKSKAALILLSTKLKVMTMPTIIQKVMVSIPIAAATQRCEKRKTVKY